MPQNSAFAPHDPDFETRVRQRFARQKIMGTIGAALGRVEPGVVEITLPFRDSLTQQNGFHHAGITSTIADSAGGCAALTLLPPGINVLTVEYKINLLAPAAGERFLATGRVVRMGRTLIICEIEVAAIRGGQSVPCAFGLQTVMQLPDPAPN